MSVWRLNGSLILAPKNFQDCHIPHFGDLSAVGNQGGARWQVCADPFAQPEAVYRQEGCCCRSIAEAIRVRMAPYDATKGL
jgi:hypothetical protein